MAKEVTNEDLALMMKKGFDGVDKGFEEAKNDRAAISDEMNTRFTKIENQLRSVENYKVTQLQLIKILREKKILTKQDAATLGVT